MIFMILHHCGVTLFTVCLPLPISICSLGSIEMETGTDGSQYAPDMDRRAPLELHLSSEPFMPPVNLEPHMHGLYSSDSMPTEMPVTPCTTDKQYWAVTPLTPMTPMEEQGTYCPSPALSYQPPSVATSVLSEVSSVAEDTVIEDSVPNASSYGSAVRHTNTLSEPEEGSSLVHGRIRHQLGPLPQAKIGKPEVQCDRSNGERVTVQYRLPSYCTCSRHRSGVQYVVIDCSPVHLPLFLSLSLSLSLSFSFSLPLFLSLSPASLSVYAGQTMEDYIKKSSLEEDGGYYCMESLMQVVRTLEKLHSKLCSGHGAFSGERSHRHEF